MRQRPLFSLVSLVVASALVAASGTARADGALPPLPPADAPPADATSPDATPTNPPATAQRVSPIGVVPDTVFLKSGGLVRGTVAESAPGDHVTIAMPTGEIRRIPWAAVDRISVGDTPPPVPAAPPAPPPEAPKRGPLVRVHITSDHAVLLDRRPQGAETWVPACASPCDEDLPLGDTYRLSGASVRATNEFRLESAEGGRVDLKVDAATKRAWWVGAGIGGLGLVVDFYGAYIGLLGALLANQRCATNTGFNDYDQMCASQHQSGIVMRNVGLVMLIPGTAAAIIGGAMMAQNWKTGLTQSTETAREPQAARPLDAFKRTAETRATDPIPAAPTLWVPLASGTF
jgi:hypothetical protein